MALHLWFFKLNYQFLTLPIFLWSSMNLLVWYKTLTSSPIPSNALVQCLIDCHPRSSMWTQLNKRVRWLIIRWCNSFQLTFYNTYVLYLPVLYRRLSQRTNHPQIYQWWEMSRAKWPCLKSFDKLLTYCLCLYLYAHIAIVVRRNWNFIVSNMLCKYIMNPHYTGIALYSVLFLDMLSIFAQFSMNIMLHDYCCAI